MNTARTDNLPIVALLSANAVSLVGNTLTAIAVPWFVLETTGSAARTGAVAFATLAPTALASVFGGAIVDRVGNRRMSILADLVSGLTVAVVPLLYRTVGLAFWQLLVLMFLGAALDSPGSAARQALQPDLSARAGWTLERANGAAQAIQSGAALVGPLLAGVLIAFIGPSDVLLVDAATFVASALIVWRLVPADAPSRARNAYCPEFLDGVRFLRRDRVIVGILALGGFANFFTASLGSVVLPVFTRSVYDSSRVLGLLISAVGGGELLGALTFGAVGARFRRLPSLFVATVVLGLAVGALATEPRLAAAMAVFGYAAGSLNPMITTVMQERVPAEYRARVFGAISGIVLTAAPLGVLLAGFGLAAVGLRAVLLLIAAGMLGTAVIEAAWPAFRSLEESRPDGDRRSG